MTRQKVTIDQGDKKRGSAVSDVTVWVPGLLHPERLKRFPEMAKASYPVLQKLLARADRLPLPSRVLSRHPESSSLEDFYATASYLAHQPATLPIAATQAQVELSSVLATQPELKNHFWVKVDPVQMMPDRDTLRILPPENLQLSAEESHALLECFNQHFANEGVQLHYGAPQNWYLSVLQSVDLQTTPLPEVVMQSLHGHTPCGNAASYWLQLMNETQMLFFSHPVNEARREAGRPEANGVWVWGEGQLTVCEQVTRPQMRVQGENLYLAGLAHATQAAYSAEVKFPDFNRQQPSSSSGAHAFIVMDALEKEMPNWTVEAALSVMEALEQHWWQPLFQALKSKHISSLLLVLGNGEQYYLEPKHLRRFWRLSPSLI